MIQSLIDLVPPPTSPSAIGNEAGWRSVEKELGTELPNDYKQLINTYGSGIWQDFWYVYNPFCKNENLNLLFQSSLDSLGNLWAEKVSKEDEPDEYPFNIYPEGKRVATVGNY